MAKLSTWNALTALATLFLLAAGGAAQAKPAAAAAPAAKDVLVFTNGDQLSGTLDRGVGDSIVFKSDMAGEITVKLDKIKELRTNGNFAVLQHGVPVKESRKLTPAKIDMTEQGIVLATGKDANPAPIPIKNVAYIIDEKTYQSELVRKTSLLRGWNGTANLGASFEEATQHGGTFNAGLSLVRQIPVLTFFRPRNRTTVNVQETYGTLTTPVLPPNPPSPDATVKTSIFHADAERDEYFSKKGYGFAVTAFDHNFSQALDLQQIYGGGIGYTPFSTPVQRLDLKADVHYEKQMFIEKASNDNLIGSTFSEVYHRTLSRGIQLNEAGSVLPAWNNLNAYSANGNVNLTLPVFKRLGVSFGATDSFLNNPPAGYKKNSFQLTAGMTYAFH